MTLALQIIGGLIVCLALMQAALGLASQVGSTVRARRMERRKLEQFKAQSATLLEQAKTERERTKNTWTGKRKFRIAERQLENEEGNICSFYLEPHDGGVLPSFKPGQFLTFELSVPDQPAPVIRCYSLSDSPLNIDRYRVSIKRLDPAPDATYRAPGGLSSCFFHNTLKQGDVVDVMAPNGSFHLDMNSERPVVLIAGGIGLTPVLSMLKWLSDTNSPRVVWFFYAASHGKEIALISEIREIVDKHPHFHCAVVFSSPTKNCVEGRDFDCQGFLSVDVMKPYLKSSNYEFYICGPPPMMNSVTSQLAEWGVPEEDINMEAFGPASIKPAEMPEPDEAANAEGHMVEFARSGRQVKWTPDAGSLLDLAEAEGIRVNFGCRAGNCSTCLTALKSGKVGYVRKPAAKLEHGSALLCIARPEGDISLDA